MQCEAKSKLVFISSNLCNECVQERHVEKVYIHSESAHREIQWARPFVVHSYTILHEVRQKT